MRTDILFCVLIVCLQTESAMICDICDCQEISEPSTLGVVVNCSFHEGLLEVNHVLPEGTIKLDLSRSNLTNIQPASIFQSSTLAELLLNRNLLKEINLYSSRLPQLRRLDLNENELEILKPYLFKGFTNLEYLNLANNKFTAISQLNFNFLVNLKEIILDNNNLGDDIETRSLFETQGYGLPLNIQSISISGVNLNNLNLEYFKPVDKTLRNLTISHNNLTIFVKLPQRLEYLDYSNNPIRNITSNDFYLLEPLVYLRELKLNNLEIEEVPKNVFSTLMLTNLELKYNKHLKEFSNLTFGRQLLSDTYDFYLENLTLKGSNLSTLDKGLSVLFVKVKRLDLQQNPWVCDCRLAWLRKLPIAPDLIDDFRTSALKRWSVDVREKYLMGFSPENILTTTLHKYLQPRKNPYRRCRSPIYLYNKRIFDLDENDFICLKSWWNESHVGVTIGLVFYTLLVFMTFTWIYIFIYHPAPKVNRQEYSQL